MANIFDQKDTQSLTTKVFKYIRDGIIDGRYHSGDILVATKLAEEFGVSRTPIREALKQLELEDLIESIPNCGVTVKGISKEDITDIFIIRYLLEGLAANLAASRIKQPELDKLLELIDLMELYTRRRDYANLAKLDTEFHEIIFIASNSRTLKHILGSLHQNAAYARQSSLMVPERAPKSFEEHKEIYAALCAHDAARAQSCMERHVQSANYLKSQGKKA
ncbi:MAG: GntR family transcriptional regulator [Clostridiales bacterium]|nr:GntR family transcriptional regulator [Clostridiales bacterium]